MQPPRITWANTLRGFAAVSVALGAHMIVAVWSAPEIVAGAVRLSPEYAVLGPTPAWAEPFLLVDWGALGVCLFFLISGLVIPRSLERQSRLGFVVGRGLRILPTYAVGYCVVWTVVLLNSHFTETTAPTIPGLFAGMIPGLGEISGVAVVPNVEWTLIIELGFYVVTLIAFRALVAFWWAPVLVGLACAPTVVICNNLLQSLSGGPTAGVLSLIRLTAVYLPIIMIGALLSRHKKGQDSRGLLTAAVAVLAAITYFTMLQPGAGILGVGVSTEYRLTYWAMIPVFVAVWSWSPKLNWGPVGGFFANISYSLYVSHLAVSVSVILVLIHIGWAPILATMAGFATATAVAWVIHVVVEVPTHRLGRRLTRRLSPQTHPTADQVPIGGH
ncbi:MAG: acyltransferase [Actinomycetia bacterium]|nr:acyltransferase [Actinomycetes bacterium]